MRPAGLIREQVMLITDDANSPQVPVLVEAKVESAFYCDPRNCRFRNSQSGRREVVSAWWSKGRQTICD